MVKNEMIKQIISFFKLFIGLIGVEHFPISNYLPILIDSRANWAIDTTFYALIINIISSIFAHQFYKKKLYISVTLENPLQDCVTSLTTTQEPSKAFLELKIKGRKRKVGAPIFIRFPDWIDVQTKNQNSISLVSPNCISIDVDEIMGGNREIDIKRRIRLDITSNTDEQYEEVTDMECQLKWWKRYSFIDIDFKRMKIKNKWR